MSTAHSELKSQIVNYGVPLALITGTMRGYEDNSIKSGIIFGLVILAIASVLFVIANKFQHRRSVH